MRLPRTIIMLLCLAACFLTGCEVPKDSPNPDGISSCPAECVCTESGDTLTIRCDGETALLQ
jgi:hypothetical protein